MSRISTSMRNANTVSGFQDFVVQGLVNGIMKVLPFKDYKPEHYLEMANTCNYINFHVEDGDTDSAVKAEAEVLHKALLSHDDWADSELSPNKKGTGYIIRKEPDVAIRGDKVALFVSAFADALSIKKE